MFEPLTNPRREFLARSVMDVLKFVVAAALASGFFGNYPMPVRIALAVAGTVLFLSAWFLFPPKGGA